MKSPFLHRSVRMCCRDRLKQEISREWQATDEGIPLLPCFPANANSIRTRLMNGSPSSRRALRESTLALEGLFVSVHKFLHSSVQSPCTLRPAGWYWINRLQKQGFGGGGRGAAWFQNSTISKAKLFTKKDHKKSKGGGSNSVEDQRICLPFSNLHEATQGHLLITLTK